MQFKIKDTVVYGNRGVCKITEIKERNFNGIASRYYVLSPVHRGNETIFIPVDNEALIAKMRPVISKDDAQAVINSLSYTENIWTDDENERREIYKSVFSNGSLTTLVSIYKALAIQKHDRLLNKRKLHQTDEIALQDAQKLVCDELSAALDVAPTDIAKELKCCFFGADA